MFWSKKKQEPKLRVINVESHVRELLFDSQLPEADKIATLLGSQPISPEILEKEMEQSELRVERLAPLLDILHSYAALTSAGMIKLQRQDEDSTELPEQFWRLTNRLLEMVSYGTLVGAISQLVELDLIKVTHEHPDR
jgi:hypothetical protein